MSNPLRACTGLAPTDVPSCLDPPLLGGGAGGSPWAADEEGELWAGGPQVSQSGGWSWEPALAPRAAQGFYRGYPLHPQEGTKLHLLLPPAPRSPAAQTASCLCPETRPSPWPSPALSSCLPPSAPLSSVLPASFRSLPRVCVRVRPWSAVCRPVRVLPTAHVHVAVPPTETHSDTPPPAAARAGPPGGPPQLGLAEMGPPGPWGDPPPSW